MSNSRPRSWKSTRSPVSIPDYHGWCKHCGREHHFTNQPAWALSALDTLFDMLEHAPEMGPMAQAMDAAGGKMVGVLICGEPGGSQQVLKSFSGEISGVGIWPGWVNPVMDRSVTEEIETGTLQRLAAIEARLASCDLSGAQQNLARVQAEVEAEANARREISRAQRKERAMARSQGADPAAVDRLAQEAKKRDKAASARERARVEQAREVLAQQEQVVRALRDSRRQLSATCMAAMLDAVQLTNARGETRRLRDVFMGEGVPTGTGECAAPKLLQAANRARLHPVAMVEAWWGPSFNGRNHGDIQPPCAEKCLPILGYLLCGLDDP